MIRFLVYPFYRKKLEKYSGFKKELFHLWYMKCGLSFSTKLKFLNHLSVIDDIDIRDRIRAFFEQDRKRVKAYDYIISLGEAGKSGDIILYEFRHSLSLDPDKFIRVDELVSVEKKSAHILFVDDLIGTGTQSVEYINNRLNLVLQPKMTFDIFTLFTSRSGLEKVSSETNVRTVHCSHVIENDWDVFSPESRIFTNTEKARIRTINDLLASPNDTYNKGIMIAFRYGVPNNSIRLIWKHKFPYTRQQQPTSWNALLPRKY